MSSLAVRNHIATIWPSVMPALFLAETDNTDSDYNAGLPNQWASIQYGDATESRVSLGKPACYREVGTIIFKVHTKSGLGNLTGLQLAEQIRAAFSDNVGLNGYFRMITVSPPVDAGGSQGDWYRVVVQGAYTYETYK